jgi:oligopeptide/dipeptide ABC transporter ATP-binding protein
MTDTLLDVQGLVKHFPVASRRVVQAVTGVSFRIGRGETLALVGESGSGKTTIGRCVLGLIDSTAGKIAFEGKPIGRSRTIRSRELRGRIQLVFQEPSESLNPRIRIGETIAEPLRYVGTPRADRERQVKAIADRLGLAPHVLDQFPAELTAGQQQRVCIGRAIITDPALVVLDEPTSALDPTARAEIIDLLIKLQNDFGTAYLFISHDLSTVRFISHRVAVLYLGTVVEEAPAKMLFARPLHPYSVGLLDSVLLPDPQLVRSSAVILSGEIPSPIDLPPGCPLSGRCPFVQEDCRAARPTPVAAAPNHFVACTHYDRVEALDQSSDLFAAFQEKSNRRLSVGAA